MSKFFNKKRAGLKISNPLNFDDQHQDRRQSAEQPMSPVFLDPGNPKAIILIAKYDFQAHNSKELTVSCNEPLKLLSRQGNGWLLAKPIGRLGGPGLVPSAYCSIVKTDVPLSEEWLNGSDISLGQQSDKSRSNSDVSNTSSRSSSSSNSMADVTTPTSISSFENSPVLASKAQLAPFISTVSVKTVSSYKGRYWYRTDVVLPNGRTSCLCRYYQDFYSLHTSLYDQLSTAEVRKSLPKLPGPIPRPDPEVLLQRCHYLNAYVQNLHIFFRDEVSGGEAGALQVFKDFLQLRSGDVEIDENEYMSQKTEEINKLIAPVSPTRSNFQKKQAQSEVTVVEEASQFPKPPPMMDTVNIQLLESAEPSPASSPLTSSPGKFEGSEPEEEESPATPKKQQLQVDVEALSCSPTTPLFHNNKPKLDFITERRNMSPVIPSTSEVGSSEDYIRVKVVFNDGQDIIAMKMLKESNLTILKLSISSKIQMFDYVLTYKDVKSGFFKPLRTNRDLEDAVYKKKITIRVNEVAAL